jgi:hypothetical protein
MGIRADRPRANDVPSATRARIERYLASEFDALRQREREKRQRIETIRDDMRSGRRPRKRLPGE